LLDLGFDLLADTVALLLEQPDLALDLALDEGLPELEEANNFLWPFKLSSPLGGMSKKGKHFTEGGDFGNREEEINRLVRRMN